MEMGNVSKRQQPDHIADNSRGPPMSLQCSEKLTHPEASFSWPLNKYVYWFSNNGRHTKLLIIHKKLKLKRVYLMTYHQNKSQFYSIKVLPYQEYVKFQSKTQWHLVVLPLAT